MTAWPKDTQAARNSFYGDPGIGQIASQMVPVVPPFAMYYEGKRVKAIQFHKKAAPALLAALNEIWDYCQRDQAKIDAAGVSKYAGAYNHRLVRGSKTKWSNHAYAAAIDLNAGENALGVSKGTMPQFVVDAFCRQGAMWGGWYQSRPDWMHFEFVDNGGRKPKSAAPVLPPVAHLFSEPEIEAPADELEGDAPAPTTWTPPAIDPDVTGDPELYLVQKRLKGRKYSPGVIDGIWGSGTAQALAGFANDRHLTLGDPPLSEVMKSGPLKGTPKARIQTCEVLALALRFEKLVLSYRKKNVSDDQRDRLWERMRAIAEKASWMSPRSFEGAAFQIQLAAYLVETAHVSTNIERSDLAHAHRLLYRAMDRVGEIKGFGWEVIRGWLMPAEKDQKKPSRARRAR